LGRYAKRYQIPAKYEVEGPLPGGPTPFPRSYGPCWHFCSTSFCRKPRPLRAGVHWGRPPWGFTHVIMYPLVNIQKAIENGDL